MLVNRLEHRGQEYEEANVLVRSLSRLEQIQSIQLRRVGDDGHRPVAVLSGPIDSSERLLVEQRLQAMSERDAPERRHHEHVVVDGEIGLLEVRGHLELAGRDFVVTSGDGYAELVQLEL